MIRMVNMGALQRLQVYRTRSVWRGLGQDGTDFIDPSFASPDISAPSIDIPTSDQIDQQIIADSLNPQVTTSEAGPSSFPQTQPSHNSSTSSASSGGTDILSSVGKFFASIFTPSNISAAEAAAAAKASAAKNPGTVPLVAPAAQGAIDTNTLMVVGGLTAVTVILVAFISRP